MNKRQFLSLAAFGLGTLSGGLSTTANDTRQLQEAGTQFRWSHKDNRLTGHLSAPTTGWIAVGFNADATLRNTRFIIAHISGTHVRAEEHIALVPGHRDVVELGLTPTLSDIRGIYDKNLSHLRFSLPHYIPGNADPDLPALSLSPGSQVHLMLAWSHAPEFEHHSAWRKHFNITL